MFQSFGLRTVVDVPNAGSAHRLGKIRKCQGPIRHEQRLKLWDPGVRKAMLALPLPESGSGLPGTGGRRFPPRPAMACYVGKCLRSH